MPKFIERLTRQKVVTFEDTNLKRVLTTLDLTALGIGSTVGVGFYVLAGEVARNIAGPAVTISFLIAAIASVLAGVCYAEFGARVPKAGSAYIYSYVCVGEFIAFVIGWNLILEYVIGASSVARGFSGYIDQLSDNAISNALEEAMPISIKSLSDYPDFLAFGLILLLSVALAIGVKDSSRLNNIFTFINLFTIAYVIIAGATQADVDNWSLEESELVNINGTGTCQNITGNFNSSDITLEEWGTGGFAPYGFAGIMRGAATCFYGFVGFDVIATTGEEAINPARSIPISITLCLSFVFLAYFGASTVLTLGLAYCLQDIQAPIVYFFKVNGMNVSKWIVSIGALFGFSASLFGSMFPIPRIIYAMADDGLLFRFLAKINKKFHTPVIATILTGLFAGVMAMLFDTSDLMAMMNIGTLLAYTIVAICVILLRYDVDDERQTESSPMRKSSTKSVKIDLKKDWKYILKHMFCGSQIKQPSPVSASIATWATLSFSIICFVLCILLVLLEDNIAEGNVFSIVVVSIVAFLLLLNIFVIYMQPESSKQLSFKVPLVPWVPAFSTFVNFYLMCHLSSNTWIRFAWWMAVGLAIYFFYGMCHSSEESPNDQTIKGYVNEYFIQEKLDEHVIPDINIVPATPMSSRPTTIRRPMDRRPSIVESPMVLAERREKEKAQNSREYSDSADSSSEIKPIGESDVESIQDECDNDIESSQSINCEVSVISDNNVALDNERNIIVHSLADKLKMKLLESEGIKVQSKSEVITDSGNQFITNNTNRTNSNDSINKIHKSETRTDHSEVVYCAPTIADNDSKLLDESETINNESKVAFYLDGNEASLESTDAPISDANESSCNSDILQTSNNENIDTLIKSNVDLDNSPKLESDFDSFKTRLELNKSSSADIDLNSKPKSKCDSDTLSESNVDLKSSDKEESTKFHKVLNRTNSFPTTPVGKPHPIKRLIRSSSFEDIPPSSPDSPGAHRVKKFLIIPVKCATEELEDDHSTASHTPLSPVSSIDKIDSSEIETFQKLHNKLKVLGNSEDQDAGTPIEDDSVMIVSKEFKKIIDKDTNELHPIRERGESKIIQPEELYSILNNYIESRRSSLDNIDIKIDIMGSMNATENDKEHFKEHEPVLLDVNKLNENSGKPNKSIKDLRSIFESK